MSERYSDKLGSSTTQSNQVLPRMAAIRTISLRARPHSPSFQHQSTFYHTEIPMQEQDHTELTPTLTGPRDPTNVLPKHARRQNPSKNARRVRKAPICQ